MWGGGGRYVGEDVEKEQIEKKRSVMYCLNFFFFRFPTCLGMPALDSTSKSRC